MTISFALISGVLIVLSSAGLAAAQETAPSPKSTVTRQSVSERPQKAGGEMLIEDAQLVRPTIAMDAGLYLKRILEDDYAACTVGKLRMYKEVDRSIVLDQLIANSRVRAITGTLMEMVKSDLLSAEERQVIVDRTARHVAMNGNIYTVAELLSGVPEELFEETPEDMRVAIFEEVIRAMKEDSFDEVNAVVLVLGDHLMAVPEPLWPGFVLGLLNQSWSQGYQSQPAAKRLLGKIPANMAVAAYPRIPKKDLIWHGNDESMKEFLERHRQHASDSQREIVDDLLSMKRGDFIRKYDE